MVVATCRDLESIRSRDGAVLVADLVRDGHVMEVRGIALTPVRDLIASIAGAVPSPGKAAAIHDATAGNPLFVREVTRLVSADDPLDHPGPLRLAIPPSVRAVIRRRIEPLGPDAVATLAAAAVVGREFDLRLVTAASEMPREQVFASLEHAVALGVVTSAPRAPGTYRFVHPLMREVVYDELPLPARAQMHRHVGEAIERMRDPQAGAGAADLAVHFAMAASMGAPGDAAKALAYARAAGDRAREAWAYEEAAVMYQVALEALDRVEPDELARCELLLRLGEVHARAGSFADARSAFVRASAIARRRGDPERLACAALGLGEQPVGGGLVDRELVALLQEALDAHDAQDDSLRARLLARLSVELTFADEEARRDVLSREALEMARRLGDSLALTHAWRARWMATWGPAGLVERTAMAEEMLALALAARDPAEEVVARARRLTCLLEAGDMLSVDAEIAAHARLAAQLRMPLHEWTAATLRAMRALLRGSLEQAEGLIEAALRLQAGRPNAASAHLGQSTLLRWEQGRLGELRDAWHALIEQFPQAGFGRGWLSVANAELGRTEEARLVLRAAVDEVLVLPRNGLWLLALASSALAAAQLGEDEAAAALYPLLLPYADRTIIVPMPHPITCYGSAAFYAGSLAATLSRWDEAVRHFELALDANRRLGAGAFLVRTQFELARTLLRRGETGDAPRALVLLRRAAAAAGALGLVAVGAPIERLLASTEAGSLTDGSSAGLRRPASRDEALADILVERDVFQREGEIWRIEHEGTTVRMRDAKGMRCLSLLLAQPGREILALDLEARSVDERNRAAVATEHPTFDPGLAARDDLGDAGELLDARAKAAYRARLDELRDELREAEEFNDSPRAARVREEIEILTMELSRAVGLGGRDRRAASHADRARLNVTRAIRAAMQNIARVHPALGDHLTLTIRTGRYCCYAPDPRVPIRWRTDVPQRA
jgi:tetratricopeptide (TPR) repeat protein